MKKIKSIFVYVKKIAFGKEKSNMCLLNKTMSFGFKNISDLFLRTKKIGIWFVLKNQFCFLTKSKKFRFVEKL